MVNNTVGASDYAKYFPLKSCSGSGFAGELSAADLFFANVQRGQFFEIFAHVIENAIHLWHRNQRRTVESSRPPMVVNAVLKIGRKRCMSA